MKIIERTTAIGIAASKIGQTWPRPMILPYQVYCPIAVLSLAAKVSDVGIQMVFLRGEVA